MAGSNPYDVALRRAPAVLAKRARRAIGSRLVGGTVICLLAATIAARGAEKAQPDKGAYSLLDPTPDSALRDFTTDRPGKITNPITVDAGRLQLESDLANYLRSDVKGVTIRAVQTLDPTFKLGLTSNVDFEMTMNGAEFVRQRMDGTGATMRLNGLGDVFFRAKINLLGNDGGDYAVGFVPYVKVPSSTGASLALGDGVVEGGGLALLQVKLPGDFTLNLQSELDALEGGNDSRRHANFVHVAAISHAVPGVKALTATAEIFTSFSTDRFTPDICTADFGLAYMLGTNTQLDVGINFGLNRTAPDHQVYTGVSHRF